jgi:ABC-2 type transport system permease protein
MAQLNGIRGDQLQAIAILRTQLFVNSLRSIRGRLNLVSRALAGLLVLGAGIGGGVAVGSAAWGIVKNGKLEWLALPFWLVCLFWQFFPVLATAFHENIDTSSLLRFPLSYPSYFLVRLVFGALDIATALGLSWSLGLLVGISVADPRLLPWALLTIAVFCGFNILLARAVFVWIEHWLSRRRSREVLGVIFLLVMIGFQIAGPVLGRYSKESTPQRLQVLERFLPAERALPPGLAAVALSNANAEQNSPALTSVLLLIAFCVAVFVVLHRLLRQQYRGENLSETDKRSPVLTLATVRRGWKLPILGGTLSSVFEKEIRYFSRSGPMLFTIVMPLVMVFVLWGGRKAFFGRPMGFVFPVGAAYCLLVMTNIVYNSFGGDGSGIQFFLFSPVGFGKIAAGKNLAHLTVLALDVSLLWLGVSTIYQPPKLRIIALTLTWLLFAVPLSFSVGNLLSIYSPKRIDYATFGRQRASETTIIISLAVQLGTVGIGALAVFLAQRYSNLWIATLILAALSIPSITAYFVVLRQVDKLAMTRREVLTSELCRV